jgi:hypothetical protein
MRKEVIAAEELVYLPALATIPEFLREATGTARDLARNSLARKSEVSVLSRRPRRV